MFLRNFNTVINQFTTNPANAVLYLLIHIVTILISLILHECAHGQVAYWCGDPTAKQLGRITLDPRKHLDPIGTVSMLLFGFGWAKPVPINPRYFRRYRRDYVLVSMAGIVTNLMLFLLFTGLAVILNQHIWADGIEQADKNIWIFVPFNIIYDGNFTGVLQYFRAPALMYLQTFFISMSMINISLAVFNLLPVPPLDGWRILDGLVLRGRVRITPQVYQIIRIAMLVLLFTGATSGLLSKVTTAAMNGVLSLYRAIGGIA